MPWTRKQVKYLLSSGSPLTGAQKTKMKSELHDDPAMGHVRKGHIAGAHHNVRNASTHAEKLRSS